LTRRWSRHNRRIIHCSKLYNDLNIFVWKTTTYHTSKTMIHSHDCCCLFPFSFSFCCNWNEIILFCFLKNQLILRMYSILSWFFFRKCFWKSSALILKQLWMMTCSIWCAFFSVASIISNVTVPVGINHKEKKHQSINFFNKKKNENVNNVRQTT
jgi:hypothetical protein